MHTTYCSQTISNCRQTKTQTLSEQETYLCTTEYEQQELRMRPSGLDLLAKNGTSLQKLQHCIQMHFSKLATNTRSLHYYVKN